MIALSKKCKHPDEEQNQMLVHFFLQTVHQAVKHFIYFYAFVYSRFGFIPFQLTDIP
jgi:hypothetical protein